MSNTKRSYHNDRLKNALGRVVLAGVRDSPNVVHERLRYPSALLHYPLKDAALMKIRFSATRKGLATQITVDWATFD